MTLKFKLIAALLLLVLSVGAVYFGIVAPRLELAEQKRIHAEQGARDLQARLDAADSALRSLENKLAKANTKAAAARPKVAAAVASSPAWAEAPLPADIQEALGALE